MYVRVSVCMRGGWSLPSIKHRAHSRTQSHACTTTTTWRSGRLFWYLPDHNGSRVLHEGGVSVCVCVHVCVTVCVYGGRGECSTSTARLVQKFGRLVGQGCGPLHVDQLLPPLTPTTHLQRRACTTACSPASGWGASCARCGWSCGPTTGTLPPARRFSWR